MCRLILGPPTQREEQAGYMPAPTVEERVFQAAISGDLNSLMRGKFLPCSGLQNNPDVTIHCACGFQVEGKKILKKNAIFSNLIVIKSYKRVHINSRL